MLITAQWYTKSEQAPRFAFWHSAPGVGQLLGALLSFAFQSVPKSYPIHGWRLMFIALGVMTLVVGVCCWFYLPDSPMQARFLNDREKVALLNHVSVNMTGVENRKVNPKELWEATTDVQVWMLTLGLLMVSLQPVSGPTNSNASHRPQCLMASQELIPRP
jgi:sugar phosphate permease